MININNLPKKPSIYKLINKINGKIYIGKTFNLKKRIKDHSYAVNKKYLCSAIKKYGWNNFEVEILNEFEYLDNIELLALECAYIEYFNSTNQNIGYNRCLFSNDKSFLPVLASTRQKMSNSKLGIKNKFFGKRHSQETIKKLREKQLGIVTYTRQVKQINKHTNNIIKVWDSIKEAGKFLCISDTNIVSMCSKNPNRKYPIKSVGGFKWEYV